MWNTSIRIISLLFCFHPKKITSSLGVSNRWTGIWNGTARPFVKICETIVNEMWWQKFVLDPWSL